MDRIKDRLILAIAALMAGNDLPLARDLNTVHKTTDVDLAVAMGGGHRNNRYPIANQSLGGDCARLFVAGLIGSELATASWPPGPQSNASLCSGCGPAECAPGLRGNALQDKR